MTPAQPPPPTNWNFPFQFSGIHTSMSICESAVGRSVAATRQNDGTARPAGAAPGPPRPPPRAPPSPAGAGPLAPSGAGAAGAAGGVNVPAATISAVVMVVVGSVMDLRFAHGVGAARAAPSSIAAMFPIMIWDLPSGAKLSQVLPQPLARAAAPSA